MVRMQVHIGLIGSHFVRRLIVIGIDERPDILAAASSIPILDRL